MAVTTFNYRKKRKNIPGEGGRGTDILVSVTETKLSTSDLHTFPFITPGKNYNNAWLYHQNITPDTLLDFHLCLHLAMYTQHA